jgi:predicted dithiol-disulfide oxidoreductase (DUF899 family)
MPITFPGESANYRAARDALLQREIELRRAMEDVARARRELPPGGIVPEDYELHGAEGPVRLSELFARGRDSLVVYHMMFPRDPGDTRPGPTAGETARLPLEQGPCPSCVALLDQLDGSVEHVEPHINFAVVAQAPIEQLITFGRERGWRRLRLYSAAGTTFSDDYGAMSPDGASRPMLNVFRRDGDVIRHFWGSELFYAPSEPGQDPRHVGTIEASWNMFDLTPEGRGEDWDEQLCYHCGHG